MGAIVTHGAPEGGRNSTTVGTDFLYRNSNFFDDGKSFQTSLWYAKSIDANDTGNRENNGYGVKLEYPNDRFNWLLGFEELQDDYQPRLGFVNRNDIRHLFGLYRYRTRPSSGPIRTIDNEIFGQVLVSADSESEVETALIRVIPAKFTTPINDGFDVRYSLRHELVQTPFFTFDIPNGTYTFHEVAFNFFTSRNRPVRTETQIGYGSFFDGTQLRVDADLELRPSHYFFIALQYEFRDINLPKAGSQLSGNPERNDRDTQLVRLKFDLLFTPNITWSNFIQYDNVSDQAGLNSRFRYILQDGREFFIVFNQGANTDGDSVKRTRTEALVKAVWTFTF